MFDYCEVDETHEVCFYCNECWECNGVEDNADVCYCGGLVCPICGRCEDSGMFSDECEEFYTETYES